MIPMEPPINEQHGTPFYHPPPPTMGYPPPPMPNPYTQQYNQMPYPPQQQAYNPYQVKEGKKSQGFIIDVINRIL
jgi:hypothetical protein